MIDNSDLNGLLQTAIQVNAIKHRPVNVFYSKEVSFGLIKLYTGAFLEQAALGIKNHISTMHWDVGINKTHQLMVYLVDDLNPEIWEMDLTEEMSLDILSTFERLSWRIVNRLGHEKIKEPFTGMTLIFREDVGQGRFKAV